MIPSTIIQALFLILAMSLAGIAHLIWLRSPAADRLGWPVDGGLQFRGKRIFGDNKRLCGFCVLPFAAVFAFMGFAMVAQVLPEPVGAALWGLSVAEYGALGFVSGLAFLLAELPNSFFKRQMDIAPGDTTTRPRLKWVTLVADRFDSVIGCLIALSLLVTVPPVTWFWVLVLGAAIHALFSVAMHALGLKRRAL